MADTARLAQQQSAQAPSHDPVAKTQAASGYFGPPQPGPGGWSGPPPPPPGVPPAGAAPASNGQHGTSNHSPFDDIRGPPAKPFGYGQPGPPTQQQPQFRSANPSVSGPMNSTGAANSVFGQYGQPAATGVGPAGFGPPGLGSVPMVNGPGNRLAGPRPVTNGEVFRQQAPPAFQQGVRPQGVAYHGPSASGDVPRQTGMLTSAQPTDWKRQPPNSLPVPYHPYGSSSANSSAYTPSPATSEPPSAKSSRNPSPISTQRYDALEGQFTSTFNNSVANIAQGPVRPIRPTSQVPPGTLQMSGAPVPPPPQPSAGGPVNSRMPFPTQPAPAYAAQQPQGGFLSQPQQPHQSLPPPTGSYGLQQQPPRGNSYPPPSQQSQGQSYSSAGSFQPPPPSINSFPKPPPPTNTFAQQPPPPPPQANSYPQHPPSGSFPPTQGNVYSQQQPPPPLMQPLQQQQPSSFPPRPPPTDNTDPSSGQFAQYSQQPNASTDHRRINQQQYPPMPGSNHAQPPFQSQPGPPVEPAQWSTSPPSLSQPRVPGSTSMSGPTLPQASYGADRMGSQMRSLNLHVSLFERHFARAASIEPVDLLCTRNILPTTSVEPPKVILSTLDPKTINCSPDIFRCTLTKIPETQSVLQKCRLPLGIIIHPFKDLGTLPVVQCSVIVRCRTCRTYINPFVQFLDQRRWKCNLCFRVNELQEEFMFDPMTKTYGDPTRRPEIKSATIEFIAPSEYMLRPPQPAVYLFLLDVSYAAVETGYLRCFCETLLDKLENLPGDSRTRVGFMTYSDSIQFYNLAEGLSQPQMMVVSDIEDVFLPCPDNLLVNLHENMELVKDLLMQLPIQFTDSTTSDSALGAALQAAKKLVGTTGGRITVMQVSLPNVGPGALKSREDPNLRAGKVRVERDDCCLQRQADLVNYSIFHEHVCEVPNLGPANDFYKKLSLDCSGNQVAVDLFLLSSQYCDIATLSCISKYSGGSVHFYPGFHAISNSALAEKFEHDLKRYFTRKIGFEAVMRIRCTKGLSIHTFHGNFFVRSTDLLSLPNINPDAGFGMQMSIEESLSECSTACFQAALLYTSSKGERRIRVHTMCLPVSANVLDVINSGDQQAIACLLTKMAVDRSQSSSMPDARDALLNACVDAVTAYKLQQGGSHAGVVLPYTLRLLPMYILAIMKHVAFRLGTSTKLDERVYAMNQMKTLPLSYLMNYLYSSMYPVHNLDHTNCVIEDDKPVVLPPLLNLTAEKFERQGVFLLDSGEKMFLYVCQGVNPQFCQNVLNVRTFEDIPEKMIELPELDSAESVRLRTFINYLQGQRPFHAVFQVLRNNSKNKQDFLQHLIEDRTESTYSYFEFLKHIQSLVNK